jgi:hypothetical protein
MKTTGQNQHLSHIRRHPYDLVRSPGGSYFFKNNKNNK